MQDIEKYINTKNSPQKSGQMDLGGTSSRGHHGTQDEGHEPPQAECSLHKEGLDQWPALGLCEMWLDIDLSTPF